MLTAFSGLLVSRSLAVAMTDAGHLNNNSGNEQQVFTV